ncbi:MAG TPA: glutamine amidotransferase [Gemmataceae bacterium]|nr:glutamine amidotransferase [Gemmataceae bacterium]
MFHFSLEQGHSLPTMLVVTVVAALLTSYFYGKAYRLLAPMRWRILFALRLTAVVLIVLLLFRPVLSLEKEVVQRRALIFLVDSSASMATADDASGNTRFELARLRVADWWSRLAKDFDLHLLEFSDRASPLERPDDLARVQPTGEATSLTRAFSAAAQKVPRRDVEAVVLLSDGIHNAAGDPVQTARRLGLKVHAIGVGNSLRGSPSYKDIQVTGLECPDQLPVDNRAKVTAFVDAVGYGGRVVKVFLEEDGKQIDQAELVLDDVEGAQEVVFQFVPTVKGRHTYTARVPVAADEKIAQNNQRSTLAQVVDARIRVLYLEGTLRAEYGALVDRFLSKDPDIEFCALVQTRRNVFVQRTNMEGLKLGGIPTEPALYEKFDVFLLGDLDSTYWKPEQITLLVKRIRDGAGLLMFGGYHSLGPGGYGGTPLEEILPVLLGAREIGQIPEPFLPVLTPAGRGHGIFANIGKFFPGQNAPPQVEGLPPLDGCVKVLAAKPAANILAVYGTGTVKQPMPVLAVYSSGKGRSAVFTGDTTRNWQQVPRALDQESPFLRFWGQMVRWLANRTESVKTEAGISTQTDKAYYAPDAPITITAVVRDKEGEGTTRAQVSALVKNPRGKEETVPLSAVPGSAGHYSGVFEPRLAGNYEILAEAALGGKTLRAERISIAVGRPNLEFDRLDLDERMLSQIAAATGGRYHHISTADRLIDELDRKEKRRHVSLEQPLYFPTFYWVLFVGVLASEWTLRKRYQLR